MVLQLCLFLKELFFLKKNTITIKNYKKIYKLKIENFIFKKQSSKYAINIHYTNNLPDDYTIIKFFQLFFILFVFVYSLYLYFFK